MLHKVPAKNVVIAPVCDADTDNCKNHKDAGFHKSPDISGSFPQKMHDKRHKSPNKKSYEHLLSDA